MLALSIAAHRRRQYVSMDCGTHRDRARSLVQNKKAQPAPFTLRSHGGCPARHVRATLSCVIVPSSSGDSGTTAWLGVASPGVSMSQRNLLSRLRHADIATLQSSHGGYSRLFGRNGDHEREGLPRSVYWQHGLCFAPVTVSLCDSIQVHNTYSPLGLEMGKSGRKRNLPGTCPRSLATT